MVHISTHAGLRVVVLAGGDSPERESVWRAAGKSPLLSQN